MGVCTPILLSSGCACAPRYVTFLCARLMEVSVEQRAAHIIQKHWCLSRLRSAGALRDQQPWRRATSACWPLAPDALLTHPSAPKWQSAAQRCLRVVCERCSVCLGASGGARRHLHTWIAAAAKVQCAWRAHAFRRGLQRAPALRGALQRAVARLQAMWRARPARAAFLRQRAAAMKLQVGSHMQTRLAVTRLVLPPATALLTQTFLQL